MNIPEKLGKYEIKEQLGRGSMGIVYRGYDPFADRDVAVKVAMSESLNDSESGERYRKMFFNEAHTAGTLKHPNIVEILDAGVDETDEGDHCYIIMELVENGDTLKTHCHAKNLLPLELVIEITFKCAKALDYAHRNGVVHRDIKPTNILITKDRNVKIADFSIAHLMTADSTSTMPMGFVGSPRYMSPEQVQEDVITNQTDLFSLGIVMYELLTGKHPFAADSFSRLIHMIINEKHPPLSTYRTDIPEILEKIIHHALQKDPERRYKMGLNFAGDLSLAFDYLEEPQQDVEVQEKFNSVQPLSFFSEFPESEIWEIIHACIWQTYEAGNQIIVEGDIDDSFYIIISGEVDVNKDGALIGNLKTGDCFGEMAYLSKSERTATILAKNNVSLMKVNATLIEQVSVECQLHFSKVFMRTLVKRLSDTTAMYASSQE
ncbi:MAG TPA: cyclic nucleotide-binding domain-containing protein [Thiotrichaceae bacterium]|jgi:serine/threonine protein kinase|nr:cyclic nucleotide-binding domain-containing protein [Thiotrichaceae bacterium]HIM07781.1 cyclic nucleotide-binding domain-containing protein [Gammaproteobacteria bacterium]